MSQLKDIKLNTPTYKEVVPSSQKEVRIKPFKVGDEKTLLIASESQDKDQIISSLKRVMTNCLVGEEVENLTSYDVEYLFLKIRAKSVGEVSKIGLKCKECDTQNEIEVDLETVNVKNLENRSSKIKITDELYFEMKEPDIDVISSIEETTEGILKFICRMVTRVYYGEETIEVSPADVSDVLGIVEQLTTEQFKDLENYVQNIPKLHKEVDYVCKHCGTENKVLMEGLTDFF